MPLNDAHFGGYFFAPEASKWTIYAFRGHNFSIRGLHPGPFFTFLKKVVYFLCILWYNNHVSNKAPQNERNTWSTYRNHLRPSTSYLYPNYKRQLVITRAEHLIKKLRASGTR
jgi:hypothetical protein